jgi:hypothetical protein
MDSLITIESMYSRNSRFLLAKQRERNLASSSMSAARKEAPMKEKEHLESADSPSPRWGLAVWVFPTHTAHPRNTTLNKFIHVAIITPASSRFFKVEKKYSNFAVGRIATKSAISIMKQKGTNPRKSVIMESPQNQ